MTDYKNLKLRASSNPHIRNGEDTRGLMLDVIIALMPALLFGVWQFGVRVAISRSFPSPPPSSLSGSTASCCISPR